MLCCRVCGILEHFSSITLFLPCSCYLIGCTLKGQWQPRSSSTWWQFWAGHHRSPQRKTVAQLAHSSFTTDHAGAPSQIRSMELLVMTFSVRSQVWTLHSPTVFTLKGFQKLTFLALQPKVKRDWIIFSTKFTCVNQIRRINLHIVYRAS